MKFRLLLITFCLLLLTPSANAEELPDWLGKFCNNAGCFEVSNLREGPMGYFIYFSCTKGEQTLGDAAAPVEGREGNYSGMTFTLTDKDNKVKIIKTPNLTPDAEDDWTHQCLGVFKRTE